MRRFGVDPGAIDTVFLSHLHGDHFAGLPFLLLEAQFVAQRSRPLTIVGPPGTRQRLLDALELLFPDSSRTAWRFPLEFVELRAASQRARWAGSRSRPIRSSIRPARRRSRCGSPAATG